jgi:hypothetical protein
MEEDKAAAETFYLSAVVSTAVPRSCLAMKAYLLYCGSKILLK